LFSALYHTAPSALYPLSLHDALPISCGRGAYGLLVAKLAGTPLIGVDFSAQAITEARQQAARMGVDNASFRTGGLTAPGLPDARDRKSTPLNPPHFPHSPPPFLFHKK